MLALQSDLLYWLAALRLPGIGPMTLRQGLTILHDIKNLFTASDAALQHAGFKSKQINSIKHPNWHAAEKDLHWCEKNHCHIITMGDENYPRLLKEIHGAPIILFVQGEVSLLNEPQLAIVGSRNPSVYGKALAEHFAQELIHAGVLITSGLALGIDTASHRGALSAGGKTLAVYGTGLKTVYPASNARLAEEIQSQGALISEFPPDTLPDARNFPRRNRIISGLSLGVLVIEAALRSGSLITARYAADQGREVFAIPGSIHNPLMRGCHQLIRDGAKLVESYKDIIEEITTLHKVLPHNKVISRTHDAPLEQKTRAFLAQMGYEVTSFDTIMQRSGLTAGEVSSMLLTLELQGYIQAVRGGYQLKLGNYV